MSQETNYDCSTSDGVFQYFFCHYSSYNGLPKGPTCSFSSAWCGSATTSDTLGHKRCCWPHHCAAATACVLNVFAAYANYATGPLQESFSHSWASHWFVCICWCLSWCLLSIFSSTVNAIFTCGGSTIGVCIIIALWSLPMAGICASWW